MCRENKVFFTKKSDFFGDNLLEWGTFRELMQLLLCLQTGSLKNFAFLVVIKLERGLYFSKTVFFGKDLIRLNFFKIFKAVVLISNGKSDLHIDCILSKKLELYCL